MNIGRLISDWTNNFIDRTNLTFLKPYIGGFASSGHHTAEMQGAQDALAHLVARLAPPSSSGLPLAQDLQAEAKKLIADHTRLFNLDEDGLGRTLAVRVENQAALAREVYRQLGESDRVQVARVMAGALSDDQLRSMVWDEDGRALLYDLNRWIANNSLTGDGRANAAGDQHLRERIGVALSRTDDITQIAIGDVQRVNTYEWNDRTGAATNWTTFGTRSVKVTAEDKQKAREWFDRVNPEWQGKPLPKGSEQAKELARVEKIVAQNKYNSIIADAARQNPIIDTKSLKALLIQESGLDPQVVNSYGYAGIAQFGARDARAAGLIVNGKVDERLDPQRAITAAARFLQIKANWLEGHAYSVYGRPQGEEYLKFALAAYNGGEGVVAHAMKLAYEKGSKEAQGKGLTGDSATAYAREYATKWDNLLQPTSDIHNSPLYGATSKYYPKIAESKYREIGAFPTDIRARAKR